MNSHLIIFEEDTNGIEICAACGAEINIDNYEGCQSVDGEWYCDGYCMEDKETRDEEEESDD